MNSTVVTLGEILLRLSPPQNQKFLQAGSLDIHVGGAEANVAVALSNFGVNSRMVSRVPDNDLGKLAVNRLRSFGVDTRFVVKGEERMGLYFLETGFWARPSKVIYDRANSAMCCPKPEEFDLEKIFENAQWFHTSGITPAISDDAAELTLTAMKYAKKQGIRTSLDINFRQKLWDKKKAKQWLTRLCEYTDVYIGNTGHAELLLEIDASDHKNYQHVFTALHDTFGFKQMACTIRNSHSASLNDIGAIVHDGDRAYQTRIWPVSILDRVGSGDSFTAGLIYGLLSGQPLPEAAEFAVAASALKHTIPGDLNYLTLEDVTAFAQGDGSGKVAR